MRGDFVCVRTVGGLLPPDVLARVLSGDADLGGLRPADYHLAAGESPREAANRAWSYLTGVWASYRAQMAKLPEGDAAVGLTRSAWLLVLLRELGYGQVPLTGAGGLEVAEVAYPVSHLWGSTPMHLLGWGVDLDKRTKGVPGAAGRAPHAMVQELLNRSDDYLWALVSNGRVLRLLRDSTSLAGQAFVEFDLEAMFDGEVFSDFVLLYLLAHQSRVEVPSGADGQPGTPVECWLEKWRTSAAESGTRALGLLRDGVKEAIEALGSGFLAADGGLNADIAEGRLRLDDYHRALLRLVYRLLFLFVAEDRDVLLLPADGDPELLTARDRYDRYFSTARLRRLALKRRGARHGDLWEALRLVIDALGREDGRRELALPGIGGLFDHGDADVVTDRALPNSALLTAIRTLTVVQPKGQPRRVVDYRNLGAEELGSIYESLLELMPRHDAVMRSFTLAELAGNERKTSGSYYTPSALIDLVLDETLDPLLDEAEKADDPEAALLAITTCDSSCGSGHFLVSAGRRIATRLAAVRTRETDPTPTAVQDAMHDVVSRCLYGVDLNPMAADLAKVSLWLESMTPGRPLSFLDAHIKVGNALLGVTPALLAAGIPDAAYTPIEGDDKKTAASWRKANKLQRDAAAAAQDELFATSTLDVGNAALRRGVQDVDAAARTALSLTDLHLARARYRDLQHSPEARRARLLADAWCAAFVAPKTPGATPITHDTLTALAADPLPFTLDVSVLDGPDVLASDAQALVTRLAAQYRFFHWHLEFPDIFRVPDDGPAGDTPTGWHGGFACALGNPPWDQVQVDPREFFASRDESIANAPNMAKRNRMIAALAESDPDLLGEFRFEQRRNDAVKSFAHGSGRYPLTSYGRLNTYSLFAEGYLTLLRPTGRAGIVTPTGLMTDSFNQYFAAYLTQGKRLAAFYDFENEAGIFPGVHNQFRFAVTCMTGGGAVDRTRLAFYTRYIAEVPTRRFALAADEILQLNPNTGTLPVFRTRRDAEITLAIYRRHPVLMREATLGGNPWGLSFSLMFMMNTGSEHFRTQSDLLALGARFDGWAWVDGTITWLPLYEAKLLSLWDHRYATYDGATQAQLNKGTLPRLTDALHDDPSCEPLARYWVAESEVDKALDAKSDKGWLLGWRDIARASDARTFTGDIFPRGGAGGVWCAYPSDAEAAASLSAIWSSYVWDYVCRQKISGAHMTLFVTRQIAVPTPVTMVEVSSWLDVPLGDWIRPRVLELVYTSYHIAPFARDLGDEGEPFRWIPERREAIRAELDAAMFHVYGLARDEVEHVLDSFFVVRKYEERDHGEFRTKRLVLDRYDAMAAAATRRADDLAAGRTPSDPGYVTPLDPPPGRGPRHPARA